jgi:hypothetical protein
MMIAIEPEHWQVVLPLSLVEFVDLLKHLAQKVKLSKFLKATRAPKKKQLPRIVDQHRHRSSARLLDG